MKRCITIEQPTVKFNGILFVGEAAGEIEEASGKPFQGKAGKLLNDLLKQAGITRSASVITNVFHMRPPENKVLFFFTKDAAESEPVFVGYPMKNWLLRGEFGAELYRLKLEIEEWKPKVIVALGGVALWALTGRDGISQYVGAKLDYQEIPVVPCFHPSYLLRSGIPSATAASVLSLITAKQIAKGESK